MYKRRQNRNWIQKIDLKKGSLRKWLKTKSNENIKMSLLRGLKNKPVGTKTKYGVLTARRKRQINLAINFKRMK
tara:strand:- start:158 stop:379 length:222 start_codon:yes stop_codon:yes gene_type:complete